MEITPNYNIQQPFQVDLVRNTAHGTPADSSIRRALENPQARRFYLNGVPATFPIPIEFGPADVVEDLSKAAAEQILRAALSAGLISLFAFLYALKKVSSLRKVGQQLHQQQPHNNLVTNN